LAAKPPVHASVTTGGAVVRCGTMMAHIETVAGAELEGMLARVLAPPGRGGRATRAHVRSFVDYVSKCGLEWTGLRARRGEGETALLLVLVLPGNTAIVMFPAPGDSDIRREDQQQLLASSVEQLAHRRLHYAQALIEPEAADKHTLLQATGFRYLTQLIYLQREASAVGLDLADAERASWLAYDARHHEDFARVLVQTYEDSRDCPELTGLRPIDAVIASHKAAGQFDPGLWEVACIDGEHAGCILLSTLPSGRLLEVVYMGVVPAWRGRGVGKLLLGRAVEHCRAAGASQLTAVVDRRNTPARPLYARFGFKATARREAYVHPLRARWVNG